MTTSTLLQHIKAKDWAGAHEAFKALMEQRIAARIEREKKVVGEAFGDDEDTRGETGDDFRWKRTFGFNKKGQIIFVAPGKLSYADVKEIYPAVVKVEHHGREYGGAWDEGGWVNFSVDTYGERYPTVKELIQRLARLGIPAKPGYTPYLNHVAVAVPEQERYIKRTGKELYGSSNV